jgi:hypothetical protein
MLGWFAELNPKERRTMGACVGGEVPARHPRNGELKSIEDAPGS